MAVEFLPEILMGASLVVTAIGSLGTGLALGRYLLRRNPETIEGENAELSRELKKAKKRASIAEHNEDVLASHIETLRQERDTYQKIAETHDISNWDKFKDREYRYTKIWKGRLYCDLPKENMSKFSKDLKAIDSDYLSVIVRIEPLGGWKFEPMTLKRQGTASQIISELNAALLDNDYGLVTYEYPYSRSGRKIWKDKDSPIRFVVEVNAIHDLNKVRKDDVHVVEVAVTSTEHEVVKIEKPVFIDDDESPEIQDHTKDEIIKIIREYDLKRAAELEVEHTAESHMSRARRLAHSRTQKQ